MLELHQSQQLPLKWRQIEVAYAQKWENPLPKRINLLLANGARDEKNEGPLYIRKGTGVYDILSGIVLNLNPKQESRHLYNQLTKAIEDSQINDELIVYPNSLPYQGHLTFNHALSVRGRADKEYQVIRGLDLNLVDMKTTQHVTLQHLTFKDSIESHKKTHHLEIQQGNLTFNDCEFEFETSLEITIHAEASLTLKNSSIKAKTIKLDIQEDSLLILDHAYLSGQSGIELKINGQFNCFQSHVQPIE